jgi:hypothetical protein
MMRIRYQPRARSTALATNGYEITVRAAKFSLDPLSVLSDGVKPGAFNQSFISNILSFALLFPYLTFSFAFLDTVALNC